MKKFLFAIVFLIKDAINRYRQYERPTGKDYIYFSNEEVNKKMILRARPVGSLNTSTGLNYKTNVLDSYENIPFSDIERDKNYVEKDCGVKTRMIVKRKIEIKQIKNSKIDIWTFQIKIFLSV